MDATAANRPRWDGRRRRFYEAWDAAFAPPGSNRRYWLRWMSLNPAEGDHSRYGAVWFAATRAGEPACPAWTAQRGFEARDARIEVDAARVEFGDARFSPERLEGALEQGRCRVSWDLTCSGEGEPLETVSPWVNRAPTIDVGLTLARPRLIVNGWLLLNGERVEVVNAPGVQAHYWGEHWAHGWLWARCAAFAGRPGVVAHAATVKFHQRGPLARPAAMLLVDDPARGRRWIVNDPWSMFRVQSLYEGGRWVYVWQDGRRRLEWDIQADPRAMATAELISTYYRPYWHHLTAGAASLLRLYERESGRWRQVDELFSPDGTAAEVMTDEDRRPDWLRFGSARDPRLIDRYALRDRLRGEAAPAR